jgi:nickel-dependent lactate racemase
MLRDPQAQPCRYDDNPMRQDVEEIGALAGIHFALNGILTATKALTQAVAGSPRAVMESAIPLARAIFETPISNRYDLIIAAAGGYPKDINFYQAQKALAHASLAVKEQGMVVLVAACPEGIGSRGYERWMLENGPTSGGTAAGRNAAGRNAAGRNAAGRNAAGRNAAGRNAAGRNAAGRNAAGRNAAYAEVFARFEQEGFRVGPHKALLIARDGSKLSGLWLVSELSPDTVRRLLLTPASLEEAVHAALSALTPQARVGIMPLANATVPRLETGIRSI